MKIALLSDLHANRHALHACLAHAQTQGATQFIFLGDLVGYGGQPAEVVSDVMELVAKGALVVKGNHDVLALNPPSMPRTMGDVGAKWTQEQLNPQALEFLNNLPYAIVLDSLFLVHASADFPEQWHYVDNERAATRCLRAARLHENVHHVFCGHVHHQTLYFQSANGAVTKFTPGPGMPISVSKHRWWLGTIGSVGQPRDGDPRAMYATFDSQIHQLTFFRIPYDHEGAAQTIRDTGALPDFFAQRLFGTDSVSL